MELWVRSQDKEKLLKIDGIQYQNCKLIGNETIEANILIGFYSSYDNEILAEYKTKERALQVIDEIQDILKPKMMAYIHPSEEMTELLGGLQLGKTMKMKNDMEYKEFSTYVYQMPEE